MKPTRRRLQISLRTFLVLVTVLAVWLGWQANRLRRQAEAVRAFQRAGCIIGYRVPPPAGRKLAIEAFAADPSWRDYFRAPTDLVLKGDAVDDELCRLLDDLPELRNVETRNTRLSGAVAERIGRLERLETIFIHDRSFSEDDVERLKELVPPGCEIFSDFGHYQKPG